MEGLLTAIVKENELFLYGIVGLIGLKEYGLTLSRVTQSKCFILCEMIESLNNSSNFSNFSVLYPILFFRK